ncbi:MAG: Farnesyl-diphosphate farnesyltransferase [Chthoniobacter sp.]|nr:Farnesyl-diphosphate farnesyltransferase [Chthoniobacter sp.]
MKADDLNGRLLAAVSRSFYLTIRVLPSRLQGPIGLAYLLARTSDTIADTETAPPPVRLRHLAAFHEMIRLGTDTGVSELQREIRPPDQGESELLQNLERCLLTLRESSAPDREEITSVMDKIIRGQTSDLQRFADTKQIVALPSAAELDEYTYLVAGCVGEFWTNLCLRHLPRYSALDPNELRRLGINYGKGLQLVNILRDAPADLRAGRCYLPADELRAIDADPATLLREPATARPVFARWSAQATAYLDDGFRYLCALRPPRLRVGCFLPWYLGRETLRLLSAHPPLEQPTKLKVPRSTVHKALLLAVPVAFSNAALRSLR